MSFYRMGEQNRGRGVHSKSEEGYTTTAVTFAAELLTAAVEEMQGLFSLAKNA